MIVRFMDAAEHALEGLGDYSAQDNLKRALGFVRELRMACLALVDFPERFALFPRHEERGVRRRVQGDDLIFNRVETDPSLSCTSRVARSIMPHACYHPDRTV